MSGPRSLANLSRRDFVALTTALGLGGLVSACGLGGRSQPSIPIARIAKVPDPIGSLVTRWRGDPFARGSYSFLANGAAPSDRDVLAAPASNGRLHFAGEATDRDYPATVHGALMSGERAARQLLDTNASSVVVIGAGAAGLAAARRLAVAGLDVEVLEARDRVGGRVWTDDTLGVPLDLGASWIHGVKGNPLTDLADAMDAPRSTTDYDSYRVRDAMGTILDSDDLPREFEDVTNVEHEFGADVTDLSPDAIEEGEEFGGGDVIFAHGYLPVVEMLIQEFQVETGVIVERVETTASGVEVSSADASFSADAALVTVPLGVLKAESIEFMPPLDEERQRAIGRLGMGLLNKVCVQFDEIFWESDIDVFGYIGPERGHFSEWLNIAKYTGEPILVGFNAASAADQLEALTDQEVVSHAMAALRNMFQTG